jgi:hypothetical protein
MVSRAVWNGSETARPEPHYGGDRGSQFIAPGSLTQVFFRGVAVAAVGIHGGWRPPAGDHLFRSCLSNRGDLPHSTSFSRGDPVPRNRRARAEDFADACDSREGMTVRRRGEERR